MVLNPVHEEKEHKSRIKNQSVENIYLDWLFESLFCMMFNHNIVRMDAPMPVFVSRYAMLEQNSRLPLNTIRISSRWQHVSSS